MIKDENEVLKWALRRALDKLQLHGYDLSEILKILTDNGMHITPEGHIVRLDEVPW